MELRALKSCHPMFQSLWSGVEWVLFTVRNTWHPLGAQRVQGDTIWYVGWLNTCCPSPYLSGIGMMLSDLPSLLAMETKQSHRKPSRLAPSNKRLQSRGGYPRLIVLEAKGLFHQALNFYSESSGQHFQNCLLSNISMPWNVMKIFLPNIQNWQYFSFKFYFEKYVYKNW